ncbi:MAG: hypothetical protein WAW16_05710, partial [Candidatus Cryosericum sp.]
VYERPQQWLLVDLLAGQTVDLARDCEGGKHGIQIAAVVAANESGPVPRHILKTDDMKSEKGLEQDPACRDHQLI